MKHIELELFYNTDEYIESLVKTLGEIKVVIALSSVELDGGKLKYVLTIKDLTPEGISMDDVLFRLGVLIGVHEADYGNSLSKKTDSCCKKASKTIYTQEPKTSDEDMETTYQEYLEAKVAAYLKKYKK